MIQFCGICAAPASLGTLGATQMQMQWRCPICFARAPQVTWGTPHPEAMANSANETDVTIMLDSNTARIVAAALEDWAIIMSDRLDQLAIDEHHPDGWCWDDIPLIFGAAKIIRDAALADLDPQEQSA